MFDRERALEQCSKVLIAHLQLLRWNRRLSPMTSRYQASFRDWQPRLPPLWSSTECLNRAETGASQMIKIWKLEVLRDEYPSTATVLPCDAVNKSVRSRKFNRCALVFDSVPMQHLPTGHSFSAEVQRRTKISATQLICKDERISYKSHAEKGDYLLLAQYRQYGDPDAWSYDAPPPPSPPQTINRYIYATFIVSADRHRRLNKTFNEKYYG